MKIILLQDILEMLSENEAFDLSINDKRVPLEYQLEYNLQLCAELNAKKKNLENYLRKLEKSRNQVIRSLGKDSYVTVRIIIRTLLVVFSNSKDLRFLNLAIKIADKSTNYVADRKIKNSLENLKKSLIMFFEHEVCTKSELDETNDYKLTNKVITSPIQSLTQLQCKVAPNTSVIIFCPNPKSSYTLSVIELLKRKNFKIEAVIVKKLFNKQRILKELRRDGKRLLHKVYRKLILSDSLRIDEKGRNLSDVVSELEIDSKSVYEWCKKNSIRVIKCNDFNEIETVEKLEKLQYQFGVFTGGGILSTELLSTALNGILNCHAGILPYYRGMDVIEWPVLLNDAENIGSTVHFMSSGVDEGDIILGYRIGKTLDIKSARYELESHWPYLQVLALINYLNDGEVEKQRFDSGIQFYVMHQSVFDCALRLSKRRYK